MNQLFVSGIIPGAPADLADIEPGDMVIAINHQEVTNLIEMYKLIWSLGSAGSEITFNLRRDDKYLEITVKSDSRYNFMEKRKKH
jgi:S1-C subfamily serine protease